MTKRLMTEGQYGAMYDYLATHPSPWDDPRMYCQPGDAKAAWRETVDNWLRALDKVLPRDA